MKKLTLLLIIASIGISVAGVKRVFVADVGISASASAKITQEEITLVTKSLRREAVKNLPQGEYEIMTKETVIAQGGSAPNICDSVECVISLGSAIGADYITRGTINKIRTMFALTVEIHETENGNLVASSELVRADNIEELMSKGATACAEMYRMFAGGRSPTQKAPTTYTITAASNPSNGGYVSRNPDQTYYTPGAYVNIMATPADGYVFTGWSGDTTDAADLVTLTMDGDKILTANFRYILPYTLTTNVIPSGGGYVVRNPDKETYTPGEEVSVAAMPTYGYTFIDWFGAASGRKNPITITMDGDKAVTANFYQKSIPPPAAPWPEPDVTIQDSHAKKHTLAAASLDVLGAGILLYGYNREWNVKDKVGDGLFTAAQKAAKQRNTAYTIGSIILLSGITVHIFF